MTSIRFFPNRGAVAPHRRPSCCSCSRTNAWRSSSKWSTAVAMRPLGNRELAGNFRTGLFFGSIVLFWLVVWNMAFMNFHVLGIIIPTDFHIFQRGWHQPVFFLWFCWSQWFQYWWLWAMDGLKIGWMVYCKGVMNRLWHNRNVIH